MEQKFERTKVDEEMSHEWHESWDAVRFDEIYQAEFLPRSIEARNLYIPFLKTGGQVLEAGCGPGHVVKILKEIGFNVTGVDIDKGALEKGKKADPSLDLRFMDVRNLADFPDNSFDAYLSFGVIEHFSEGPFGVLREAWRVLNRGGVAVVTAPYPSFYPFPQIIGRIKGNRLIRKLFGKSPGSYFENHWFATTQRQFLGKVGFVVEMVEPIDHEFAIWELLPFSRKGVLQVRPFWARFARLLKRFIPFWSCHMIMVVGRKP